jgi:uncharacterized protein (DUF1810 family)
VTNGFDLGRFGAAQDADRTYERAAYELRDGRKRTHWMWFVFPQIAGLGQSATSQRYAISSLEEARAYLQHPVLGSRLVECARVIAAATAGSSAEQILGGIDAQKLRSSMTLFAQAAPDDVTFAAVLDRFFGGEPDPATMGLLRAARDDQIPTAPAEPHDQPAGNEPINPA